MCSFPSPAQTPPQSVTVSVSADKKEWKTLGTYKPSEPAGDQVSSIGAPVGEQTRYVRYAMKRAGGIKRVLLGQIIILSDQKAPKPVEVEAKSDVPPVRPMHVKKTLDDTLLAAKVQYLYSCYATELLRDADGKPCGIVMANRAGRQAVLAKVIIDASDRAIVARMSGAAFEAYPAGEQNFSCMVVGGEVKNAASVASKVVGKGFGEKSKGKDAFDSRFDLVQYTVPIEMKDASWSAFAHAEQVGRDRTWGDKRENNTDELFQVPPDPMKGAAHVTAAWTSAADLDLGATQPAGTERIYVLGGCADVSRDAAAKLLRPCAMMELGDLIGAKAAADAKS